MGWRRIGRVWGPDGTLPWARTHASLPVPVQIEGDLFRVYYSTRDAEQRSSIGWVDVQIGEAPRVFRIGDEPVLQHGTAGHFDDSGVSIGSVVSDGEKDRLYYMGWNLGRLAPWRNSIGVAYGDARTGYFEKAFRGPIMDRAPEDPYTLSYPWVVRFAADHWCMWYGTNTAWGGSSADMQHVIKRATSRDGLTWKREEPAAIGLAEEGEHALARPCMLRIGGVFRIWFATRGDRYRIASAVSADGEAWERASQSHGLEPSNAEWDSEMTCYPCAFEHAGRLWLMYNGNGYGRSGFGLAVWD